MNDGSICGVAEIAALPDGTVIESSPGCIWPERYSGRRWRKQGDVLHALDPDPYRGTCDSSAVAFFKDPLPVFVVDAEVRP